MPSKKKKYNARFPAGRIKKIMQTDEEVGKVAQAVPIIISRTLELFVHSLLTKTMQITSAKNARTLSPFHMKQCILSESRFDFLKDLVKGVPDVAGVYDETPPLTPAPVASNLAVSSTVTMTQTQPEMRIPENIPVTRKSVDVNSPTKDCIDTISSDTESKLKKETASPSHGRVPNFQISMPSSFNIGKPNFYTELNPVNLTANNQTEKQDNYPSFGHNSNIDEDYDT